MTENFKINENTKWAFNELSKQLLFASSEFTKAKGDTEKYRLQAKTLAFNEFEREAILKEIYEHLIDFLHNDKNYQIKKFVDRKLIENHLHSDINEALKDGIEFFNTPTESQKYVVVKDIYNVNKRPILELGEW